MIHLVDSKADTLGFISKMANMAAAGRPTCIEQFPHAPYNLSLLAAAEEYNHLASSYSFKFSPRSTHRQVTVTHRFALDPSSLSASSRVGSSFNLQSRMGCNCTKTPPPEEFKEAIGTWKGLNSDGATVTFVLFGEGSFFYGKESGHTTTSMQGPINKWSGGNFDSKPCCFCSWHFELEKPEDGPQGLTMYVNGVKLSYYGLPTLMSSN